MTKDKTTYSTPEDDSPKMASEPVAAYAYETTCIAEEDPDIDFSDHWLYENHGDLPLHEEKETYTPEEVLDLILKDIRKIYEEDGV